jgi:uncharacterized membrane protein YdbT with pleckstrin-like domain
MGDEREERTLTPDTTPGSDAESESTRKPRDRAEAEGLPPDAGPEQDVIRVRKAMLRSAPLRFVGLWLVVLSGGIGGIVLGVQSRPVLAACTAIAALLALGGLGIWKVSTYNTRLRVTNKRSTLTVGLLSRRTTEVLHDNIRNVKIEQRFWERVWNVGRISIASSGTDEEEIEMAGVPDPHELARIVDLYRPLG